MHMLTVGEWLMCNFVTFHFDEALLSNLIHLPSCHRVISNRVFIIMKTRPPYWQLSTRPRLFEILLFFVRKV